ncbi:MAG: acyl-CoA dehydrogenase family protein [Dehalococcoidia bacterium]|jgi:hypothetical protein|nr:acyl-CoA dehydrogenase family protein [Dehalococcoidia bacterium]MDP6227618.1 acyl-CoA dehydrogenase family protein [Dehalococcoidia bacterium]MDP7082932.1 acyl-CoA dehydrogenase family protein [Dehalococcoidia bacterium]MDP7201160.1 acyl-CoA dehydrogenase family protein [Dehalococcoidia bacterium]HJN85823.1 acyl-CoA dehydrogenase family protein [Dehalococcoidia bacterium]
MDFEVHHSTEQESFRTVVRAWLEEYAPRDLNIPPDWRPLDPATQERVKEFRRRMGAQGWLAPSWPREYGGAGMSPAFEAVIQEEIGYLDLPALGDSHRWITAVMVWGTQEQKRHYVLPAMRGETITWQAFNEPDSGTDMASIKTQAVRDGNDYLISGAKAFITGRFDPDYLWTLVVTDPTRPRRLNLGTFMVDAKLPGITITTQRLLVGSERMVYLDNVRVPADCLIGTLSQGWEIVQTILEGERGGPPYQHLATEDGTVASVVQYLKEEQERF